MAVPAAAHSDYAGNGGDNKFVDSTQCYQPGSYTDGLSRTFWINFPQATGVCSAHSELKLAAITDGLSNTYLVGEKFMDPDYYWNGNDPGDNENAFTGLNWDLTRSATDPNGNGYADLPPAQDVTGQDIQWGFGMRSMRGSANDILRRLDSCH